MQGFRQRDLTRAIKAAKQAGLSVERIEVDKDGKIVIISAKPETPSEVAAATQDRKRPWRI